MTPASTSASRSHADARPVMRRRFAPASINPSVSSAEPAPLALRAAACASRASRLAFCPPAQHVGSPRAPPSAPQPLAPAPAVKRICNKYCHSVTIFVTDLASPVRGGAFAAMASSAVRTRWPCPHGVHLRGDSFWSCPLLISPTHLNSPFTPGSQEHRGAESCAKRARVRSPRSWMRPRGGAPPPGPSAATVARGWAR